MAKKQKLVSKLTPEEWAEIGENFREAWEEMAEQSSYFKAAWAAFMEAFNKAPKEDS